MRYFKCRISDMAIFILQLQRSNLKYVTYNIVYFKIIITTNLYILNEHFPYRFIMYTSV